MINWLHSVLHDPSRGWDPISEEYANDYADHHASLDHSTVDRFSALAGGLAGKRVADLGSGPGQYAVEFARLGAKVTCIDVSHRYMAIAKSKMQSAGLEAEFIAGYMDHIDRLATRKFDAIFSNVCWYYCMNDLAFARTLVEALTPGGVIMIRVQTAESLRAQSAMRKVGYWLNRHLYWKVGHVFPPRGRVASAFQRLKTCNVDVDYGDPVMDVVSVRTNRQ